ncbi:MAG: hypothetical protein IPG34_17685 [Rhodocyclaceae bacterium]|nr:hypothetical protein [Rhodocyclaceae bacterium]
MRSTLANPQATILSVFSKDGGKRLAPITDVLLSEASGATKVEALAVASGNATCPKI